MYPDVCWWVAHVRGCARPSGRGVSTEEMITDSVVVSGEPAGRQQTGKDGGHPEEAVTTEDSTPAAALAALVASGAIFADVPAAAAIMQMDERTVRGAIRAGDIPGVKSGQRYRIPVDWLRKAAAGQPATAGRVTHFRGPLLAPLCGTSAGCDALFAVNEQGQDVPEWVTCRRCLAQMNRAGQPAAP